MRKPLFAVDPQFPGRWSPRAMTGEPIAESELMELFEAARWAPSAYNNQPWRFIFARRQTPAWAGLFGLLGPGNQSWCKDAAALIVMVSKTTFDHNGKTSRTHSYDTGAAWMSLALQGSLKGLVVHGMEGFDYDRAKKELAIPDGFAVEAMAAVGRPGRREDLPEPLQAKEEPNDRKPISEIAFEGRFESQ